MTDNPVYIMLVGVPAAGKSTFREYAFSYGYTIFSTDYQLEQIAKQLNKTYNEVFTDYYVESNNLAEETLDIALDRGYDIVDDHNNLTVATRRRRLRFIPSHYTKIAMVLNPPPMDEYRRRINNRPGKVIPEPVIQHMLAAFTVPTTEEGFDFVTELQ